MAHMDLCWILFLFPHEAQERLLYSCRSFDPAPNRLGNFLPTHLVYNTVADYEPQAGIRHGADKLLHPGFFPEDLQILFADFLVKVSQLCGIVFRPAVDPATTTRHPIHWRAGKSPGS